MGPYCGEECVEVGGLRGVCVGGRGVGVAVGDFVGAACGKVVCWVVGVLGSANVRNSGEDTKNRRGIEKVVSSGPHHFLAY